MADQVAIGGREDVHACLRVAVGFAVETIISFQTELDVGKPLEIAACAAKIQFGFPSETIEPCVGRRDALPLNHRLCHALECKFDLVGEEFDEVGACGKPL